MARIATPAVVVLAIILSLSVLSGTRAHKLRGNGAIKLGSRRQALSLPDIPDSPPSGIPQPLPEQPQLPPAAVSEQLPSPAVSSSPPYPQPGVPSSPLIPPPSSLASPSPASLSPNTPSPLQPSPPSPTPRPSKKPKTSRPPSPSPPNPVKLPRPPRPQPPSPKPPAPSPRPPSPPQPSPSPPRPSPPPFMPGQDPGSSDADLLGGGNCPDAAATLNLTNVYRARHQALPLDWNPSLAASAAAYAQELAEGGCNLVHSGGRDYGENLMMMQAYPKPDSSCLMAIRSWYSEVKNYNFNAARPFHDNWPKGTGHFTQVVWRSTTSMGCGVGVADVPYQYGGKTYWGGCKVVVCQYKPPGNVADDMYFLKNVLRNTTAAVV